MTKSSSRDLCDFHTHRCSHMAATEIWAEGHRVLVITDIEMEQDPLELTMARIRINVNIAHAFEVAKRQIWRKNGWHL